MLSNSYAGGTMKLIHGFFSEYSSSRLVMEWPHAAGELYPSLRGDNKFTEFIQNTHLYLHLWL